jgi:hypothetical protein
MKLRNKMVEPGMGRPAKTQGQSVTLQEYEEGYAEQVDPTTGRDISDTPANGIEMMTPDMPDRDQGTSHEGDLGRMNK